jgi:hypothetical protein
MDWRNDETDFFEAVITLHTRADETNDIHDHDELHAAAAVLELMPENPVLAEDNYISRWIDGLLR